LDFSPVYFFPGIYGDKQELVEFRSRLSDRVPVEIIELQSLEEPLADLISMEAIGAAVAREIDRRSPEGSLRLAGYSFGGSVAFEAARHLINSGRSVCFLGIIDVMKPRSPAYNARQRWWGGRPLRLLRKIDAGRNLGFRGFVYRLLQELLGRFCSSDSLRRRVLSLTRRFWPSRAGFVRRLLLFYFRRQAIESWHPVPIAGAVFLAISQENSYSIDQWMCLCPQGSVIQLPGKHVQVFESPSLEVLLLAFEKAVRNADVCKPLPS
jgi:thioesterase domain-containing protein